MSHLVTTICNVNFTGLDEPEVISGKISGRGTGKQQQADGAEAEDFSSKRRNIEADVHQSAEDEEVSKIFKQQDSAETDDNVLKRKTPEGSLEDLETIEEPNRPTPAPRRPTPPPRRRKLGRRPHALRRRKLTDPVPEELQLTVLTDEDGTVIQTVRDPNDINLADAVGTGPDLHDLVRPDPVPGTIKATFEQIMQTVTPNYREIAVNFGRDLILEGSVLQAAGYEVPGNFKFYRLTPGGNVAPLDQDFTRKGHQDGFIGTLTKMDFGRSIGKSLTMVQIHTLTSTSQMKTARQSTN